MKAPTCWELTALAVLAIFATQVLCEITVLPDVFYYNVTATPRAELFAKHNQRQFTAHANQLQQQLLEFKANYIARLQVVDHHTELIEMKLQEMDDKLHALVLLDDINDYCVQKYHGRLPAPTTLKVNLVACMQKGTNAYADLVSGADTTLRNLKAHYTTALVNSLNDCKKNQPKFDSNYTSCVTTAVNKATITTGSSTTLFQNQMKASTCSAARKVKEIFDCYASTVFNTFKTIGEVMGLVENCMAGHEFCPVCGDENAPIRGRCPYHLSWHLSDDDMSSDKINNPFKGINKTTPCLQINFITQGVALE